MFIHVSFRSILSCGKWGKYERSRRTGLHRKGKVKSCFHVLSEACSPCFANLTHTHKSDLFCTALLFHNGPKCWTWSNFIWQELDSGAAQYEETFRRRKELITLIPSTTTPRDPRFDSFHLDVDNLVGGRGDCVWQHNEWDTTICRIF